MENTDGVMDSNVKSLYACIRKQQRDGLMSGIPPDRRSGYTLIPQSNSENSELSDEELFGFYKDGFQIITKKKVYPSKPPGKSKTVRNRVYADITHPEMNDAKSANRALSMNINREIGLQRAHVMSIKRKFSFSFSVFICFFVIAFFLSVPCEWANCTCESSENKTRELWEMRIPNIELMGHVVLVHTRDLLNMNFLLTARGSIFADAPVIRTNYTSSSGGDIIAFHGLTGQQLWRKHYNKIPSEIDCKLFSIQNQSNLPKDCVIMSYGNNVMVISSETGRTYWTLPLNIRNNKTKEVFPIIIPDVDDDNVSDFILMKDINKIQLVSGFNATVLNNDFHSISQNCSEIKDLRMHNESMLKLNCREEDDFIEMNLPLQAYLTQASRNSTQIVSQHYSLASLDRMYIHNYTIYFKNEGILCPKDCKVKIKIQNASKILWSYEAENSYVMTPVAFDLYDTVGMCGFVIKIWEFQRRDKSLKKLKSFPHDAHKLTVSFLRERIIIVVFNNSVHEAIREVNVTDNPIIQLYDTNKSIQPDPRMQSYSLIIDDVSRNGSSLLITYYSTFEADNRDNFTHTDYTLKSYIRMYDLLTELRRNF